MGLHKAIDVVSEGTQAELHSLSSSQSPEAPLGSPALTPLHPLPIRQALHHSQVHTCGHAVCAVDSVCEVQIWSDIQNAQPMYLFASMQKLQEALVKLI